jgi:hypothetical protein
MKQIPVIKSVMIEVKLSEPRIEKYLNSGNFNRRELGPNISNDFENIACRSVHAKAGGSVQVVFAHQKVKVSTIAHFLVTAIGTCRQPYRVAFAASLS